MKHRESLAYRITRGVILVAVVVGLVGCSGHYPTDADGILDRVSGDSLRVGVSHQPPGAGTGNGHPEQDPGGIEAIQETVHD